MKVLVKSAFLDKFNRSRVYNPGDVVEFDDERAMNMVDLHLAEPFEKPKAEAKPRATRKPGR